MAAMLSKEKTDRWQERLTQDLPTVCCRGADEVPAGSGGVTGLQLPGRPGAPAPVMVEGRWGLKGQVLCL